MNEKTLTITEIVYRWSGLILLMTKCCGSNLGEA